MLTAQGPPMPNDQYMVLFLEGLKEEIWLEVMALEPANCYKMTTAQIIKKKFVRVVAP